MAKLISSLDGNVLQEYALDKERMTIGRRPTNDIHIDNLAISGQHAVIITIGEDSFLEDLGSTNGTLVNGKLTKKHVLQHGDVIEIGKFQLKYINEAAASAARASNEDFEKTMLIRSTPLPAADAAANQGATAPDPQAAASMDSTMAKPAPARNEPPLAHIQVLNGASAGKELVLSKALTTLGKPGLQVAVITRRPQGYFITHVEGQQHPRVNGESVGAQAHQLNDHDVIELAGIKMEFYFVGN